MTRRWSHHRSTAVPSPAPMSRTEISGRISDSLLPGSVCTRPLAGYFQQQAWEERVSSPKFKVLSKGRDVCRPRLYQLLLSFVILCLSSCHCHCHCQRPRLLCWLFLSELIAARLKLHVVQAAMGISILPLASNLFAKTVQSETRTLPCRGCSFRIPSS
ncbi:hypothetical protein B0H65DRAFT_159646 [Neurospora tetraspora]|uniref:Uncharacterized protein n=1 Tax=Neurospora tetraspora TaxID=94610 RepID=A0AAE0JHC6_9PEZI|nr:hypothetical protein B0H65DRAFT_159646 [Neurospora tetraspora]